MTQLENIENAFTKEGDNLNLEVNNLNVSCITSLDNKFELDDQGNLVVNSLTCNSLSLASDAILNMIYPVGSIYISVQNTNPNVYFGGEWEAINGKFLLASSDDYKEGTSGGRVSHIIRNENLPPRVVERLIVSGKHSCTSNSMQNGWANICLADAELTNEQPIDHMPPYLSVNMWKRVK